MYWYYAKYGNRFGPIHEEELNRLVREGGILPQDLVWNFTMGDQWVAAVSIERLFPAPQSTPPPIPNQEARTPVTQTTQSAPSQTSVFTQKIKRFFAPLAAGCIIGFKYLAGIKFLLPVLKTGGTMVLSIAAYAMHWGWLFAVGFVLLILVHEFGHLVAAKKCGLKVGAPIFIPFMGAMIALKEAPKNAWIESQVGIGGPILGSIGAGACEVIFLLTGNAFFRDLAYTGFFLNLFNLVPLGFLDGGRIVTALSPWIWLVGFVILAVLTYFHFNFLLLLILILSLPRLFSLFKQKSDAERRYYEVTPEQRVIMAAMYFGLIACLVLGMQMTHVIR
ncbi:MAG: GYF domain-containing protein [Verrucomicrobia bacterium]|nr:GYF domain-containing protein [Verrucomicrobiota bacterium]